jgi:hypothetical protein
VTELLDLRPLDELTLTACPIVIGSGQRPFDKTTTRMPFPGTGNHHVEHRVQVTTYERT